MENSKRSHHGSEGFHKTKPLKVQADDSAHLVQRCNLEVRQCGLRLGRKVFVVLLKEVVRYESEQAESEHDGQEHPNRLGQNLPY